MSSNEEDQLAILNTELMEQLDNLKTQGLDEADLQAATTALLHSFGAKVQAATKKSQTATSGIGAGWHKVTRRFLLNSLKRLF
jgi:hypothetical protein